MVPLITPKHLIVAILSLRGSADGSPREEPDFDGLKAGKTVEIGGTRGRFRQVSAKPICRLDDIFEPTLSEVIQASGSEVLQFIPDESGSLVSSPILSSVVKVLQIA